MRMLTCASNNESNTRKLSRAGSRALKWGRRVRRMWLRDEPQNDGPCQVRTPSSTSLHSPAGDR